MIHANRKVASQRIHIASYQTHGVQVTIICTIRAVCNSFLYAVPTMTAVLEGVKKVTAVKSLSIAVGIMVSLFGITLTGWGVYLVCRKRGLIFYSDK